MSTKSFFSLIAFFAILLANSVTVNAQRTFSKKNGEALIVSTTSSSELEKIKENLEGVDPSTYRITVKKLDRYGKVKATTLGTAPISQVKRISTNSDVRAAVAQPGGLAASDVVIIIKNITKGSKIQDQILQDLDFQLSSAEQVKFSRGVSNFNYSKPVKPSTGKALILNTTSTSDLANIKASLKGVDPNTYRVTVKEADRFGNVKTTVLGTAPLSEVAKVGVGTAVLQPGGLAASDVVIIIKNITKGSKIQDQILQGLDKNFSKAVINEVQLAPNVKVSPNVSKFNYPGGY